MLGYDIISVVFLMQCLLVLEMRVLSSGAGPETRAQAS